MSGASFADPRSAKFYEHVPADKLARLQAFRARYPYSEIKIGDHTWRVIDTGKGKDVLFIPAGGTTVAEVSFNTIDHFAQRYRVIAPDYPAVNTLDELFSGFETLFEQGGIGQVHALGGSYGGIMMQAYVRAYPDRFKKLVLAATLPPNPESAKRTRTLITLMSLVPVFIVKRLIQRSFDRLVESEGDNADVQLVMALSKEVLMLRQNRADMLAALQRIVDALVSFEYKFGDLADWAGEVLLLFGGDDPASPPAKIEAMRLLYPGSTVHVFEDSSHAIAVTRQAEYYAVIEEFLSQG